jgi:hypothetical protein
VAGSPPDHDTLATIRRRFLDELSGIFVQVLEMKLLKLGTFSLEGANASRHRALSYGHIEKIEAQLKAEVQKLFSSAEQADRTAVPDGVSLPEEIKRREDRLSALAAAKAKIEARTQERFEREQAAYEAWVTTSEARAKASGKKPGGRPLKPPVAGAQAHDPINLTDEESRILPVSGGGFEQATNAWAGVDAESLLIVTAGVTQAANDKEQVLPLLDQLVPLPERSGQVVQLLADTGYCSEKNVEARAAAGIEPLIAVGRDQHHAGWRGCFMEPLPDEATLVMRLARRLKTKAGRVAYTLRKQTVEPVFGVTQIRALDKKMPRVAAFYLRINVSPTGC